MSKKITVTLVRDKTRGTYSVTNLTNTVYVYGTGTLGYGVGSAGIGEKDAKAICENSKYEVKIQMEK